MKQNIFSSLSKRKKPEDYLTNAFVFLLNQLLSSNDKYKAIEILNCISSKCDAQYPIFKSNEQPDIASFPKIEPWELDIRISLTGKQGRSKRLVYVENKVTAPVCPGGQLAKYKAHLNEQDAAYKCLTLLRHFPVSLSSKDENSIDKYLRWSNIHHILSHRKPRGHDS